MTGIATGERNGGGRFGFSTLETSRTTPSTTHVFSASTASMHTLLPTRIITSWPAPNGRRRRSIGDLGDPFFPDWSKVDLAGYERPRWFASGPLGLCCKMIEAEVRQEIPTVADKLRIRAEGSSRGRMFANLSVLLIRQARRVRRRLRRLSSEWRGAAEVVLNAVFLRQKNQTADHSRLIEIWKKARTPHQSAPTARDFSGYRARLRDLEGLFRTFRCHSGIFDGWRVAAAGRTALYCLRARHLAGNPVRERC